MLGMGPKCMKLCSTLDLSQDDIARLFKAFRKTDLNQDSNVDVLEFVVRNKIQCETLARLLMRLRDVDGSGKCLFESFVLVFWAICSSNETTLPWLILSLFDIDNTGELERGEIIFLAQLLANFQPKPNTLASIKHLETNFTRSVKLAEYCPLAHQTSSLFSMSMEMQRMLQDRTLGLYRWQVIADLRAKKWPQKTSFDILQKALGLTTSETAQMKMRALAREIPEAVFKNERTPLSLREKVVRSRLAAKKERDAIMLAREVLAKQEADKLQREKDKSVREEKSRVDAEAKAKGKRDQVSIDGKVEDRSGVWFNSTALQHSKGLEAAKLLASTITATEDNVTTGSGSPASSAPDAATASTKGAGSPGSGKSKKGKVAAAE